MLLTRPVKDKQKIRHADLTFVTRPEEQAAQTQPTTTVCAGRPVEVVREHRIKPESPSGYPAVTNLSPVQDMESHSCGYPGRECATQIHFSKQPFS